MFVLESFLAIARRGMTSHLFFFQLNQLHTRSVYHFRSGVRCNCHHTSGVSDNLHGSDVDLPNLNLHATALGNVDFVMH